ncbi:BSD domain-containing protein 1-like [Asterias rubens]|uniref:BSD domain-containing protein 1-like n=1 Tax=Asterias rubens TaxID=7604 RepID=UPI0014551F03|nr:BSD domain-containing protein 1-like [Asterias rubens]
MMASSGNSEDSWWGGWIKAAKEKSSIALEQMKRDLNEFGSTVQRDTSSAVATSAEVIQHNLKTDPNESSTTSRVKQGFSNMLGGLSETFAPKDPRKESDPRIVLHKSDQHIFDKAKARLYAIQVSPGTYCNDPDGPPCLYEDWLASFDTDEYKGEISDLLVANTDVRAIYTKLVPAVVSNADFWGRYFYKVDQLKQDEARRAALMERADMTSSQTLDDEELQWDDDEDDSSVSFHHHSSNIQTSITSKRASERLKADDYNVIEVSNIDKPLDEEDSEKESMHCHDSETSLIHQNQIKQFNSEEKGIQIMTDTSVEHLNDTPIQVRTAPDMPDQMPLVSTAADETELDGTCDTSAGEEGRLETDPTKCDQRLTEPLMISTQEPLMVSTQESTSQQSNKVSPTVSETSNKGSSLSDDWEKDFDDIDVSEEDLEVAVHQTGNTNEEVDLDDWESWE